MPRNSTSSSSSSAFPNQRLSRAEKIKLHGSVDNWARHNLESIMKFQGHGDASHQSERFNMKMNYDLAAGKYNMDSLDHVMNPFGMSDYTFPADPKHYDVITPKINTLRGEEINRPFNIMVTSANPNSHTELEKERRDMVHDSTLSILKKKLAARGININGPEGQEKTQAVIDNELGIEYSEMREKMGQHALNHLRGAQELEDKFHTGWFDLITAGLEVYWSGVVQGEPILRVVNPLYFDYDRNEDIKYIEDSAWALEWRYMAAPEVYDEFHSFLSDDDVKKIEELKGTKQQTNHDSDPGRIPFLYGSDKDPGTSGNVFRSHGTTIVKVSRCEWKSLEPVGFLSFKGKDGKLKEKIVQEGFKHNPDAGESVEWEWMNVVWECTLVGDDIVVNARPKPNQHRSIDNPSKCKLGYTGLVHNNRNSDNLSLVGVLKPHQALFDIVMYRLELALARAKGKGLIFDVAQIPRSKGMNMERWLYYLDIFGIAFINSFEEGSGKFAGRTSSFNQFKEFDLTLSNTIQQYINILDKVEVMIDNISGITPQREGQVSARDLASTTKTAIQHSTNITEPMFYSHNQAKKHALTNLLEESKLAWVNGKKGQYVMPNNVRVFFSIEPELFVDENYSVFVSNSTKDTKTLDMINTLAEVAIQQGQIELQDLIAIFQSESIAESRHIFDKSKEKKREADSLVADQNHKRTLEVEQAKAQDKDRDRQAKDLINIRDNETKLEIGEMAQDSQLDGNDVKRDKNNLDARSNAIQARIEEARFASTREAGFRRSQPLAA